MYKVNNDINLTKTSWAYSISMNGKERKYSYRGKSLEVKTATFVPF